MSQAQKEREPKDCDEKGLINGFLIITTYLKI